MNNVVNKDGMTFTDFFKQIENKAILAGYSLGSTMKHRMDLETSFLCEESVDEAFDNVFGGDY
jgi:hypothetical protein